MRKSVLFLFLLPLLTLASPQNIQPLKSINIKNKNNISSKLKRFLFGKEDILNIKPYAICIIDSEIFCVTDPINGGAFIVNNEGNILARSFKKNREILSSPVSVCLNKDGSLLICDSAASAVFQFDSKLNFKKKLVENPGGRLTGITCSEESLFVVDTGNHRILKYSQDGKYVSTWGERGLSQGEFNFPTHITCDKDYIYVTDAMNFRIQVFEHNGHFIKMFGSPGNGGGNFSKPKGIAVDSSGRIYVADAMFDNIQVFSKEGIFLSYFGKPGKNNGEFWMPSDIIINKKGELIVADTYNNRLQFFNITGDTINETY